MNPRRVEERDGSETGLARSLNKTPPGVGHHARGARHTVCPERAAPGGRCRYLIFAPRFRVVCPTSDSWRLKFGISRGDPDLVKRVHEYDLSRGRGHRSLAHQDQEPQTRTMPYRPDSHRAEAQLLQKWEFGAERRRLNGATRSSSGVTTRAIPIEAPHP
jgi:hypothetical protein